jgi:hypothetical protein
MRMKPLLLSRWLSISVVSVFLSACNSSYFSVQKTELTALDQCQQAQQSQQVLLEQQQARLDETLALLQESLELQKRQAEAPPPLPVERVVTQPLKCPPPRIASPTTTNAEALFLDKQLVGERERVLLTAIDVVLRARINTGVTMSQLDARDIQLFEREGQRWVRFKIVDPETDTVHELERRHLRSTAKNGDRERPIVEMRVAIGKVIQAAELVLVDRENQAYPFLVGRNILRDLMLVDVSRSDLAPVVREPKKDEPAK